MSNKILPIVRVTRKQYSEAVRNGKYGTFVTGVDVYLLKCDIEE